jgi:hypothetical protein
VKSIVSFDIQTAGTNGPFAGLRVITVSLMVFVEDAKGAEAVVVLFQEMPEVSGVLRAKDKIEGCDFNDVEVNAVNGPKVF